MKVKVELLGRDSIEVQIDGEKKVTFVGCTAFLKMMTELKNKYGNDISRWTVPEGHDHSSLLIKEVILKLRGEWQFPYAHEEICHCRSISAATVDQAIIAGAHSPEMVTRQTSASSACGTCRFEVEKIINYRLGR